MLASTRFSLQPRLFPAATPNPSLERDLHRHGTWPAKRSGLSSASRAKRHSGSGPSAQTLGRTNGLCAYCHRLRYLPGAHNPVVAASKRSRAVLGWCELLCIRGHRTLGGGHLRSGRPKLTAVAPHQSCRPTLLIRRSTVGSGAVPIGSVSY